MYKIGELSEALGITPKTLRHYEAKGLLSPPQRSENGYRIYTKNDFRHAQSIVALRRLDLSLDEIRDLFESDDGGRLRKQKLLALLDEKLREIDQTLAILQGRREDMVARYLSLLDAAMDGDDGENGVN